MALSVWGGKGKLVFLDLNFFIKYLFFYSRLCESLTQTCGPEYEIQQCYYHCCYCYSKWRGFGFGSATTTQRKQGPTRLTSHLTGLKIRAVRLQQIIQTTLFGGQTESEHTCSVSKNPSLHRKKKNCAHMTTERTVGQSWSRRWVCQLFAFYFLFQTRLSYL